MRYLKYFEAAKERPEDRMIEYQDDIIDVLSKYHDQYDDSLSKQIDEIIWDSEDATNRFDEIGKIDDECIRILINDLKGSWDRNINKLLDVYYDCRGVIKSEKGNIMQDLKEIFNDYEFVGKVRTSKSSDRGDDRYVVNIESDDILLKLDFNEIINRVKQITGLENISYSGTKDSISIEFYKELEKSEDEDED